MLLIFYLINTGILEQFEHNGERFSIIELDSVEKLGSSKGKYVPTKKTVALGHNDSKTFKCSMNTTTF